MGVFVCVSMFMSLFLYLCFLWTSW